MATTIMLVLVLAIFVNIFLYNKLEYVYGSQSLRPGMTIVGILFASALLAIGVGIDMFGANCPESVCAPVAWSVTAALDLGLASATSFYYSRFSGFVWNSETLKFPVSLQMIIEIIGLISSVLGIISFIINR